MKTAVSQVYSILNSNEKTKNIDFYTNSVPESAQTVPSLPVGRIIEISGNYEDFASNNPLTIQFNVQVDVWVSTMKEVDAFYFALDEVMRGNGWQCAYTEQTDDDDLEGAKRIIKRYVANISLN
ncbi:head-tail joining protein [Enterococcus faecium CRL1879]|nr:head-tail joining protein [Enterococcus faecium CRL1879]